MSEISKKIKCKFNVGDSIVVAYANESYNHSNSVKYFVDNFGTTIGGDIETPKCIVTRVYDDGGFVFAPIQNKLTDVIPVPQKDAKYFRKVLARK